MQTQGVENSTIVVDVVCSFCEGTYSSEKPGQVTNTSGYCKSCEDLLRESIEKNCSFEKVIYKKIVRDSIALQLVFINYAKLRQEEKRNKNIRTLIKKSIKEQNSQLLKKTEVLNKAFDDLRTIREKLHTNMQMLTA